MRKLMHMWFVLAIMTSVSLMAPVEASAKTFYLDANLSANCTSGNYSIANRSCTGSDGNAYRSLTDSENALAGGDTLYVRTGSYYLDRPNDGLSGSLRVNKSGTSSKWTEILAYANEQPVLYTGSGLDHLPTNQAGGTIYPHPAISISGNFIRVSGFKTYGQVYISSADHIIVENCDLGGGGPAISQGSVVMVSGPTAITNIWLRNSYVHHSVYGESYENSAAVMGYNMSLNIENCEFFGNYGPDIRYKNVNRQPAGTVMYVKNSFFRPGVAHNGGAAIMGFNDYDGGVATINLYNNIFMGKELGLSAWTSPIPGGFVFHNNTFVNNGSDLTSANGAFSSFNNLFYHTNGGSFGFTDVDWTSYSGNWNLYYSSGTPEWRMPGSSFFRSLAAWQSGSGKDAGSTWKTPNFLNPNGTRPGDFKRTSYPAEVTGSAYGAVCGAYATGDEVVGVSGVPLPPPGTAKIPSPPSNLSIY